MTTSIAKEAFVEAKQLREIAERNAKQALLEAVTPKLKDMINRQLLNEGPMEHDEEDILMDMDPADSMSVPPAQAGIAPGVDAGDVQTVDVAAGEPAGLTWPPDGEGKVTLDVDMLSPEQDVELTAESIEALAAFAGANAEKFGIRTLRISKKLDTLKEQKSDKPVYSEKLRQVKIEIESMYRTLEESKTMPGDTKGIIKENLEELYDSVNEMYVPARLRIARKSVDKIVRRARQMNEIAHNHNMTTKAKKAFGQESVKVLKEAVSLHNVLADLASVSDSKQVSAFAGKVAGLCKEIFNMANKRGTLNEGDLRLILRGLPEEADIEGLTVDVEPAPEDMGAMDDMGDMDMGGDDLDLGVGDEGDDMSSDDLEMPDLEEMDLAIDVGLPDDAEVEDMDSVTTDLSSIEDEGDDMGMGDMDMGGGEEDLGIGDEEEEVAMDEVVEISESMLRKELKRLRAQRLNEGQFDGEDHGPAGQEDQFGGGQGTGEPFVDRDDSDLNTLGESELDELAALDEMEDDDMGDAPDEPKKVDEGTRRTRALSEKVKSYKKATQGLKRQLFEAQKQIKAANLFNAKLVYANKLLANENLSRKQRVTIVNALEGAESIKEVKKLYAHLNEALTKSGKGKLTEHARRTIGGGSRAQKSGASAGLLNEGEKKEFGRWGELAGIMRD